MNRLNRFFSGAALFFLSLPPLFGPVLFGGSDTHIWSIAPLLLCAWTGAFFFSLGVCCDPTRESRVPPGGAGLAILFTASLFTLFHTEIPYETRYRLLRILSHLTSYWALFFLLRDFKRGRFLLLLLLLIGAGTAAYGIWQDITRGNYCIGTKHLTLWETSFSDDRAGGTFRCPNHLANYLQMLIPFCLLIPFVKKAGLLLRLTGWPLTAIMLAGIASTQSRAGWLGLVAALTITLCFLVLRKSRVLFAVLLLCAPLLAGGGVWTVWKTVPEFRERFAPVIRYFNKLHTVITETQTEGTTLTPEARERLINTLADNQHVFRPMMWADCFRMAAERPWLGYGLGTWEWSFPPHRYFWGRGGGEIPPMARFAHNEYVNLLTEEGVIGLALLLLAIGLAYLRIGQACRQAPPGAGLLPAALAGALAGALVHALFDFNFKMYANPQVLALLAAVSLAPAYPPKTAKPRKLLRITGGLVTLAGLLLCLQYAASGGLAFWAEQQTAAGRYAEAEATARKAAQIDPQNWRAHWSLALTLAQHRRAEPDRALKQKLAEEEIIALRATLENNPLHANSMRNLGLALLYTRRMDEGFQQLRDAAEFRRVQNETYFQELGLLLEKTGRKAEALEAYEHMSHKPRGIRNKITALRKELEAETKKAP